MPRTILSELEVLLLKMRRHARQRSSFSVQNMQLSCALNDAHYKLSSRRGLGWLFDEWLTMTTSSTSYSNLYEIAKIQPDKILHL